MADRLDRLDSLNLGLLPFEALLPLLEQRGRLTREELAQRMGEDLSVVNRSFNPADKYFFHAARIPYLCHVLQDDLLARWFQARLDYLNNHAGIDPAAIPLTAGDSLLHLVRLMRKVGALADVVEEAATDGCLDAAEARAIRRKVLAVVNKCLLLLSGAYAVLSCEQIKSKD